MSIFASILASKSMVEQLDKNLYGNWSVTGAQIGNQIKVTAERIGAQANL